MGKYADAGQEEKGRNDVLSTTGERARDLVHAWKDLREMHRYFIENNRKVVYTYIKAAGTQFAI